MNDRVRQQLRELRIDPDAAFQAPSSVPSRLSNHKLLLVVVLGVAVSTVLCLCVVLIAVMTSGRNGPAASQAATTQASVSGLALTIRSPRFRALSAEVGAPAVQWETLDLDARNDTDAVVVLAAGDLHLVDSRGALFAPTWREPDGAVRDGFAEPSRTLFALDAGGQTHVSLLFIVRGDGPYALRFARPGDPAGPAYIPLTPKSQ